MGDNTSKLEGVVDFAPNNAWAVGTLAFGATVIEHFNGTAWSVVSGPSPGLGEDALAGVTALAPNKVWTVGFYAKDKYRPPDQDPHRAPGRLQLEGCLQSQHRTSLRVPIQPTLGYYHVLSQRRWAFGDYYAATAPVKSLR